MKQELIHITLLVHDYDEAIQFYRDKLGFELVEDKILPHNKRWVLMKPRGSAGCQILMAKAIGDEQKKRVGDQAGGRVFLFLHTDTFHKDYQEMLQAGIEFVREPVNETYGTVAVFKDLYGNLWDLIGH